ncbi:Alpha/Beta hydrolase protein [Apodospora peruviana]|uniref:Alpha/Beta hydrolase protein n=1 Tax=Apodospora peruviana TaxID=516989 RepID=A0AAE0I048_9PEZI|nr:Alpha/Beta hydrolase protein [Apodospora peruviana]
MNTATVGLAVTPAIVSTLFSHYLNKRRLQHQPTAQISYDEGLHLIRSFLEYASRHTVEELQAFTSQLVPHPPWVKVDEVEIPQNELSRAAALLQEQLGPDGIRAVGGREWWQWRKPDSPLKAEWVEMKSDYQERKKKADPGNRVMLYVHGGAYFFGSVDEHRYQIQRHARKLKARAIAPRYRLAPQFPFPCGLLDCLATYLYLLTYQEPNTIILAGDSAGGGMVLSLLVILRDRGVPLPAGAVLISPWADLTHSFPSVAGDCPLDYIPSSGFHHKPSRAWPPPDEGELAELKKIAVHQKVNKAAHGEGVSDSSSGIPTVADVMDTTTCLSLEIDGRLVEIKEQIQMYTTNHLISHPLVSPVLQPTLGGLPPLLIIVGGGEMLRDEQIYIAHKCANPSSYLPPESMMDEHARAQLAKYKPTDVQLQVWDGLCHVAPTLSFTSPAKYQYRAIAQFGAWALARAQKTEIDILDDDDISVISSRSSTSDDGDEQKPKEPKKKKGRKTQGDTLEKKQTAKHQQTGQLSIGKAGDPLPAFEHHMIRQMVNSRGDVYPLPPAEELPGCSIERETIGIVKTGTVRKWLEHKKRWDTRFAKAKRRVHKHRLREMAIGYEVFGDGEFPPPSALAGRRKIGGLEVEMRKAKSMGLSLWSLWGSKHDKMTMQREEEADKLPDETTTSVEGGEGARTYSDIQRQEKEQRADGGGGATTRSGRPKISASRSHSRRRIVKDEQQVEEHESPPPMPMTDNGKEEAASDSRSDDGDATPMDTLMSQRRKQNEETSDKYKGLLSPDDIPDTGATGKRPYLDGISLPFSLGNKRAGDVDSASMMTLKSGITDQGGGSTAGPSSPRVQTPIPGQPSEERDGGQEDGDDGRSLQAARLESPPLGSPSVDFATPLLGERPGLERFVTAQEDVPTIGTATPFETPF